MWGHNYHPILGSHPRFRPSTGIKQYWRILLKRILIVGGVGLWGLTMIGCAQQAHYMETHEISHLKVVFLDSESLRTLWESTTGQPSTQFQPWLQGGMASVKTVRGFYDFSTETLYCPKWNYEVCGHELHHAALGHFHPN